MTLSPWILHCSLSKLNLRKSFNSRVLIQFYYKILRQQSVPVMYSNGYNKDLQLKLLASHSLFLLKLFHTDMTPYDSILVIYHKACNQCTHKASDGYKLHSYEYIKPLQFKMFLVLCICLVNKINKALQFNVWGEMFPYRTIGLWPMQA